MTRLLVCTKVATYMVAHLSGFCGAARHSKDQPLWPSGAARQSAYLAVNDEYIYKLFPCEGAHLFILSVLESHLRLAPSLVYKLLDCLPFFRRCNGLQMRELLGLRSEWAFGSSIASNLSMAYKTISRRWIAPALRLYRDRSRNGLHTVSENVQDKVMMRRIMVEILPMKAYPFCQYL